MGTSSLPMSSLNSGMRALRLRSASERPSRYPQMALRWASRLSRSCFSEAVWREPLVSPTLVISTTGRFEVEKLLRSATGSQPGGKSRWQITCRVVHSPGASDLSRNGSMPWSCLLILAHAASDLALSPFTIAVAIAGSSLKGSSGVEYTGTGERGGDQRIGVDG